MEKVTTKKFILALIIITLASFVFNARLFIPKSAMITTPEFEITDAIQSSFAPKYWYWQKLYHRELPLWSSENAMGYPMLGEGIIGAFFLPNIILYGLSSSPPISYNLSIVLSFMITALGTYWWLLALSLPWGIAVANSLIFAGSGFFLFHQQHIIVIQAFSLMPWIFGTTHLLAKKKKVLYIPLLAILLSQQYFSGFYQAVCITGVAISLYMILVSSQLRDKNKLLFFFFLSCVLALVLSGIQLVPNIEYFRSVAESQSSNLFSTLFSYPLKNLLTFIHPFILGSPKDGSYFKNITESGDLFWESNGYVGLIPIIFAVTGFFIKQVRKNINTFGIILMIAVILMLGKNSPFYFIFDFPPFSFFRVPARYTVIVSFMIVSMSALTTAHIMKIRKHPLYRTIVYFSLGAAVFTLFAFWYPYHDVKSITDVIDVPNSVKTIPKDTALYLYAPTINHRKIFFSEGWLHPKKYDIFKNAIRSQTNVFWGISSFNIYSARTIKWLQYADNIITEGMDTTSQSVATMSASTKNYLALTPVSTIISGVPIDSQGEYPLREKISDPYTSLSVYSIPTYNNRAYIAEREVIVANAKDGTKKLSETDFDASQSVLVESSIIPPQTRGDAQKSAVVDYWKDEHIRITASTQLKQAILVISNSFYPGWQATIDGKKTDIYPVNIRFMGIVIPEGTHTVELRYFPSSFIKGLMMTTVGVIVTIGLFLIRKRIDALGEALPK